LYFSTYTVDYTSHSNYADLMQLPWIGEIGMSEWSDQYENRGPEIQPSPHVHLIWCIEQLIPKIDNSISATRLQNVVTIIKSHEFTPYYYDRDQQWIDIKNEINMLSQ